MHWLKGIWDAMWPNIFAPSFFTVLGISLSHWQQTRRANRHHEELKQHITKGIK